MALQHIEITHRGGWPRIHPYDGWKARLREAWWVLTAQFTLHAAYQRGYDQHIMDDSARRANTVGYEDACVANSPKMHNALQSIAANGCCEGCQEAALVAKAALKDIRLGKSENFHSRAGAMIVGRAKTEIDIETLLLWAYRDELSKRQTSSAEGIWDRIQEDGQRGGVDKGHGAAQRYAHFGLPDPDAERIEKAVAALEDLVIDWAKSFDAIASELSGLITVNDVTKRSTEPRVTKAGWGKAGAKAVKAFFGEEPRQAHDRPRDVLMVASLKPSALITMHAIKGSRPDWIEESPLPKPTPAEKGTNAKIFGECRGKNLYSYGAYCPLRWTPSPLSVVTSRADYVAWHDGLTLLAKTVQLEKFTPLPPKASRTPWLEEPEAIAGLKPVMPLPGNNVSAWGTLPLQPHRGRKGPPLRTQRAGPVRYPLEGEVA